MQPYFVPYLGYWQLMNAVDKYVIFDDVNFIRKGWINRNRILIHGEAKYFRIPLLQASQNKKIKEIELAKDSSLLDKNLKTIELAYKRAPYFDVIFPLIEQIIRCQEKNLVFFLTNSFYLICRYLDITTELVFSSSLSKDNSLKGEKKILSICDILNATEYYNAIGGQELYSSENFENNGIYLRFLKPERIEYKQFSNAFQKDLSIIDVMMFNEKEKIKQFLLKYTLLSKQERDKGGV